MLVRNDLRDTQAALSNLDLDSSMAATHVPSLCRGLSVIAMDWTIVAAAALVVTQLGLMAVPAGLLLIGSRQRALGNILHDASHFSLARRHDVNDWITKIVLAPPLFLSLSSYRKAHTLHHLHLGIPSMDPDFIHDDTNKGKSAFRIYLKMLLSFEVWRTSVTGGMHGNHRRQNLLIVAWWSAALLLLSSLVGVKTVPLFAGLWIGSRATVFHAITTFREMADHVGLAPGGIYSFTRNAPSSGVVRRLLHPHNNGYHLTHHLSPRTPFYRLPVAHEILKATPRYCAATHCKTYLLGRSSVTSSWTRHSSGLDPSFGRDPGVDRPDSGV